MSQELLIVTNPWVNVFQPLAVALLIIIQIVQSIYNSKVAKKAEISREEVKKEIVKETEKAVEKAQNIVIETAFKTTKQIEELTQLSNDTHKLVNNEHGVSLNSTATALETIASMTKKPKDLKKAKVARVTSDQHNKRQDELDNRKAIRAEDKLEHNV